jgi:hypothetical protein
VSFSRYFYDFQDRLLCSELFSQGEDHVKRGPRESTQQGGFFVDNMDFSDDEDVVGYSGDEGERESSCGGKDEFMEELKQATETNAVVESYTRGCCLTRSATLRLLDEFKRYNLEERFKVDTIGDSLARWRIHMPLKGYVDPDAPLTQDMIQEGLHTIVFEIQFHPDYPQYPPYVRVIAPRFEFMTGFVTMGGSVCSEMLTSDWKSVFDVEQTLVSVGANLTQGGARLNRKDKTPYGEYEAKEAFSRMLTTHEWSDPWATTTHMRE